MRNLSFKSKVGYLTLSETGGKIEEIRFAKAEENAQESENMILARKEIEEYLAGSRKVFDFEYSIHGTEFELKVLSTMKEIPYGETLSYSGLAKRSGYPKASRAVGSVCRKNRLPLLFPCHRVIRSDGSIGNYAGGTDVKKYLLDMEKNSK